LLAKLARERLAEEQSRRNLHPVGFEPNTDSSPSLSLGELRALHVPPFAVAACSERAALFEPRRFDGHSSESPPPPAKLDGPKDLLDAFMRVAGLTRHSMLLHFSPFAAVNLPLTDRAPAGIPIPAARFAYIHPIAAAAALTPSQRTELRAACSCVEGAELLLNGGFCYVDQSGAVVGVNAAVSDSAGSPGAFSFLGPFSLGEAAHEQLTASKRYLPVTDAPTRGGGAAAVCWIRPLEFADDGVRAPFGAFAFATAVDTHGNGHSHGGGHGGSHGALAACYFRLLPANVPQATIAFHARETGTSLPTVTCPIKCPVSDVKRCIEGRTGLAAASLHLQGAAGEPLLDETPIEAYGLVAGSTTTWQLSGFSTEHAPRGERDVVVPPSCRGAPASASAPVVQEQDPMAA